METTHLNPFIRNNDESSMNINIDSRKDKNKHINQFINELKNDGKYDSKNKTYNNYIEDYSHVNKYQQKTNTKIKLSLSPNQKLKSEKNENKKEFINDVILNKKS